MNLTEFGIGMNFGDHKSWQAYQESLSMPLRFDAKATVDERNHAFDVLRKAKVYFSKQHFASLPPDISAELERGTHPSQSHERYEMAVPIFEQFRSMLEESCKIPITEMGLYQYRDKQIILSVRFDSEKPWAEIDEEIPAFYFGFWVKRARQSEYDVLNGGEKGDDTKKEYGEDFVPRVKPAYYKIARDKLFLLSCFILLLFFIYKSFLVETFSEEFWGFGLFSIFLMVVIWGILDQTRCPNCKKYFSSKKSRVEIQKYFFKTKGWFKDEYSRAVEDYKICRFCGHKWVEEYNEDNVSGN
ncbi:MAG: hypothetical protein QM496_21765 [Verrucomicrobiota bacterium]